MACLPNAPAYAIPAYSTTPSVVVWALFAGPIAGIVSVGYVLLIAWADRHKPQGWKRLVAPVLAMGVLGGVSIEFPQVLGNGKDIAQPAFSNQVVLALLLTLLFLQPAAKVLCLGSGVPGACSHHR